MDSSSKLIRKKKNLYYIVRDSCTKHVIQHHHRHEHGNFRVIRYANSYYIRFVVTIYVECNCTEIFFLIACLVSL